MKIASQLPIDPASIKMAHYKDGLSTAFLSKCNSMEFRLINGAGEGYFLLDNEQIDAISSPTVTFEVTDTFTGDIKNYTVRVLNKYNLLPKTIATIYTVVHVAEEKYDLKAHTVARNYNLIKRDTIEDGVPTEFWAPDDSSSQKTLLQILTDISGMSVTYTAPTYTPLECNIQGLDVLSAIDTLCVAFGLLWTVEAGTLKVFAPTAPDEPTEKDISDIRTTRLARQMANLEVIYPVVSNGTQRNSRVAREVNYATQGEYIITYMPFLPAIYTKTEILQNDAALLAMVTALQPNFEGLLTILDGYFVYHAYKTNTGGSQFYFCKTYADYGSGPRTIFEAKDYPFLHVPQPYYFDPDKGGSGETVLAVFELTADLLSGIGSTAAANVVVSNSSATPSTITVRNTGTGRGYVGARGLALKVFNDATETVQWWLLKVDQFTPLYTATLTSKTHAMNTAGVPGSYADQIGTITFNNVQKLTDYPIGFYTEQTIHNPFNIFGEIDDVVVVSHVEDGYIYTPPGGSPVTVYNIIIDVRPKTARMYFAEYTADVTVTSYQPITAAKGLAPFGNNSGEIPATLTITDLYHNTWNAKSGMDVIVARDPLQNKTISVVTQRNATRVLAKIKNDKCSTTGSFADFVVVPINGLNGFKPITDLTVVNKYGWKAVTKDDELVVYWDHMLQRWLPEGSKRLNSDITFVITSVTTATTGYYAGKKVATVTIETTSCDLGCMIGSSVEVVDDVGCIFNLDNAALVGLRGWATERVAQSQASGAVSGDLTPCHWSADDRCCP